VALFGDASVTAVWRFDEAPEKVWRVVADTARLNELAGLPRYTLTETPGADGAVTRIGAARIGSWSLEWEEPPAEWVAGHWFRQERHLRRGPVRRFLTRYALEPDGGGTRVTFEVTADPIGLNGLFLRSTNFLSRIARAVEKHFRQLVTLPAIPVSAADAVEVSPEARARAAAAAARLTEQGYAEGGRLAQYVLTADEAVLERIRPIELAREWSLDRRRVIELCLAAVKAELLTSRWDLLCPRCRGAKLSVTSLAELPKTAHCPSCNVAYDRSFAKNVELTFRPAPAVRPLGTGAYCLSGPKSTPHVAVQLSVAPGDRRMVAAVLPPGPCRIRTVEPGGEAEFELGASLPAIVLEGKEVKVADTGQPGVVAVENRGDARRTLVIEDRGWTADALTAHAATTLHAFRDAFATDALRPGDDVEIGSVALMFTDLKGSTALYARLGDAAAYRLVRRHFAFLEGVVREHEGAIVKTIGDAVMAVFGDPGKAVAAALDVQRRIGPELGGDPAEVVIKIGVHAGHCIAVTANDRLDYFGTTVNLAARLQDRAAGGEVVISQELAADPAVAVLLQPLTCLEERALLRGFTTDTTFIRVPAIRAAPTSP